MEVPAVSVEDTDLRRSPVGNRDATVPNDLNAAQPREDEALVSVDDAEREVWLGQSPPNRLNGGAGRFCRRFGSLEEPSW
jgi:hypothetical protein